MKIAIVLGTRPEIIKMSPIIRACQKKHYDFFILHTGQHYSYAMDKIFFKELEFPEAKYNLEIGAGLHGEQTGRMLQGIEEVLLKDRPDVVLVQGDTNTTIAGALASSKLHIPVCHVEAGLRSFDRRMPEEINRILTDHLADYLFAPTNAAKQLALQEGIQKKRVFVTGNTIVDAVVQNLKLAKKSSILKKMGIRQQKYFLLTLHRPENVDSLKHLSNIFKGLLKVSNAFGFPILFPMHPRTKKMVERFNLSIPEGIVIMKPVGFLDFLNLERHARLILTDSGGVQEEACILRVPCITLRKSTERPETVVVGANVIAGVEPQRILNSVKKMMRLKRMWKNPFGDGRSGKRIISIVKSHIKDHSEWSV